MPGTWRLLDTGLRRAADNIALNRTLLESRAAEESPNTLRFLRFTPCALLGYHQSAAQELDLDYCEGQGIEVQRRITGGGAIYFDPAQLGWELYFGRRDLGVADMEAVSRRLCELAAAGLRRLGLDARFRPRNDIEVGGRKISGTGGVSEGEALLFQGTLLLDCDVGKMLRVLRISAQKLSDKAVASARERIVTVRELSGQLPPLSEVQQALAEAFAQGLDIALAPGELSAKEQARFAAALEEIAQPGWIDLVVKPPSDRSLRHATQKFPGGLISVSVDFDAVAGRIKQVWFSGDFFVTPRRTVLDLEAVLRNVVLERLEDTVAQFFAAREVDCLQLDPASFARIVRQALAPVSLAAS